MEVLSPPVILLANAAPVGKRHSKLNIFPFEMHVNHADQVVIRALTNGKAVTEVVQPVTHDDHPGNGGHRRILLDVVRVAVAVAVPVFVVCQKNKAPCT